MEEKDAVATIEQAADLLNRAIERASKETDLIVTLNTTTLHRPGIKTGMVERNAGSRIEQIEYTITREVARYDAK